MTKLPDVTLTAIFNLKRRLVTLLDTATATEYVILQEFGETEATLSQLESLDNIKERLRNPYNRLHKLLQQAAESQPVASANVLKLLYRTIEQREGAADASEAST